MSTTALRAAVIGVGSLGRYHAQKYAAAQGVELYGVADLDAESARRAATAHGCRAVRDFRELLPQVEKPIARSLEEADALIAAAARRNIVLGAGHLERFNPAFVDLAAMQARPFFMEAERLGGFKGRGTDVDVVLDLMIHDIDLMLALMPSKVISVSACGFQVLTDLVDIANARFEFADGAVADLSASRVSRTPVRKLRVFGASFYASADLQVPELRVERKPGPDGQGGTAYAYESVDALRSEIDAFLCAVRGEPTRLVSGAAARDALALALEVNEGIRNRIERLSQKSGSPPA
jgi:predicted dehydrogenase